MYERKSQAPLTRRRFMLRLLLHFLAALALVFGSLGLGMLGYRHFEGLSWLDAFLNTAMLLGGMGPVDALRTTGGKLFAGWFALYAGMVFLVTVALVFSPIVHRVLHKFHWDES